LKKVWKKFGRSKKFPYLCTQKLKTQEEMKKKSIKENESLITSWLMATPPPDYSGMIERQSQVYYSPMR
jgi:hypothetical protein